MLVRSFVLALILLFPATSFASSLEHKIDEGFRLFYFQKAYDQASDLFFEVLKEDKKQAKAHMGIGLVFMEKGEIKAAINALKTALHYNPNLPEAHLSLGRLAGKNGKLDLALHHFKKALEIAPNYDPALYNVGFYYEQKGQLDKALPFYLKAAKANKNHHLARSKAAKIYWKKGNLGEAERLYKEAISISKLERDTSILRYRLAKVYVNHDKVELAKSELNKVISHSTDSDIVKAAQKILNNL